MRIRFIVGIGSIVCFILSGLGYVYLSSEHKTIWQYWHEYKFPTPAATKQDTNVINISRNAKDVASSAALQYCNFPSPDEFSSSKEGLRPNNNLTLQQVIIFIRHGDRSPMGNVYKNFNLTPKYCNIDPRRPPMRDDLADFHKTVSVDQLRLMSQGQKLPIPPLPNSRVCGLAMLSQLGVVQHIHNGQLLRERYIKKNHLLSRALHNRNLLRQNIYVITTTRTRTMQSVVAFLYGLIPNFRLHEVRIRYSTSDIFHFNPCAVVSSMVPSIKKVQYESYLHNREKPSVKRLAKFLKENDHPGALIDGFINGFLCKNIELPCQEGNCISLQDLDEIITAEEYTMKKLSEESPYVNKSMLMAQPLLKNVAQFMSHKLTNCDVAPDVILFSGHDTTLKLLIGALGIPDYRWPPLGSRLVFELWSDALGENGHVRVLLNGKDHTMNVKPCAHVKPELKGLAFTWPFKKFHEFVVGGIPMHFGFRTRKEVCTDFQ